MNASLAIILTLGILTLLSFVQFEKAAIDIVSTAGNLTLVNSLPENAESPILLTFGIYTLARLLHPEKVRVPTSTTLGIETLLIFGLLNAFIPRTYKTFLPFIDSGIFISFAFPL